MPIRLFDVVTISLEDRASYLLPGPPLEVLRASQSSYQVVCHDSGEAWKVEISLVVSGREIPPNLWRLVGGRDIYALALSRAEGNGGEGQGDDR